jgi:hypothetical protein
MKPRWYHGVAAAIALVAAATSFLVIRARTRERSDIVIGTWAEMENKSWNLPNLDEAQVVVPDRPHDPAEADAHRRGASTMKRVRRFTVSTNADHHRMGPIGAKVAGRLRIAALGDSVTFGWGVRPEEGWVPLLEAELKKRGHDVELINAGSPGAPTASMAAWCRTQARKLEVDRILWVRRVPPPHMGGAASVAEGLRACTAVVSQRPLFLLPPISRFDLRGRLEGAREGGQVTAMLGPDWSSHDLTDSFRAAQGQKGEDLKVEGGQLSVVDLESGKAWLTVPGAPAGPLPAGVSELFEREPDVAEALMYDGGHPDVEGNVVMARLIADIVEPTL